MTVPENNARRDGPEARAMDVAIRLGFLGLFIYWALLLVAPFVIIVVWAIILSVALYPAYAWLRAHLGGRGAPAATLITITSLLVIIGPVGALGISFAETAQFLVEGLRTGTLSLPLPPPDIADWPLVGAKLHEVWTLASTNLEAAIQTYGPALLPAGGVLLEQLAGVGTGALAFAVSVVIAGFLFGPGPKLGAGGRRFANRIVADRGSRFVDLAGATIRNVSRGVIGVAVIQSIMAGIGLSVIGIPAAGLLAFIILILGIVQIGAGPVLIPVIIWSWFAMDATVALMVTLYMTAVMVVDNVLKPIVMSRGLKTPMPVILVGVIGGALAHGLIGLFLGPIVLAVFYDLLIAWTGAEPPAGADVDPAADPGDLIATPVQSPLR